MFLSIAKALVAVCALTNFHTLPSTIEGEVILVTKNWVQIKVWNKDKTQVVEIAIQKDKCKLTEKSNAIGTSK